MTETDVALRGATATLSDDGVRDGEALLRVEDLSIQFRSPRGSWTTIVENVSFGVNPGETLGIVGESGSGKSVSALACLGLIPAVGGRVSSGRVTLAGRDVLTMSRSELDRIRGGTIGMIFQQPTRSLNPAFQVGDQIAETVRRHLRLSRKNARARAVEWLDRVGIHHAEKRSRNYPHQFSGGEAQRIMIAIALSCNPKILIADEPTTALDVTVQDRILRLIADLKEELGLGVILVSHDLGVIVESSSRIGVMYAGQVVEQGATRDILRRPAHPYTQGLIRSAPQGDGSRLVSIPGTIPRFDDLPSGCRFHPRCPLSVEGLCTTEPITLESRDSTERLCRCVRTSETLTIGGVR
ncbi:ABC transporter ATP-binding protein [Pseudonocardia sp. CA-107938]|uniref:ABC transporter ATP-binding protein n=1 Tax=Pseudonocardia sp. CA-107938 TaxID=3240021 RepID=UPI003D92C3D4